MITAFSIGQVSARKKRRQRSARLAISSACRNGPLRYVPLETLQLPEVPLRHWSKGDGGAAGRDRSVE